MTKTLQKDILQPEEIAIEIGRELGIKEQQRACPECGKSLTLRGLYGHLRLAHKKSLGEVAKLAKKAKADALDEVDEVFTLIDRVLANCARQDEIHELAKTGRFPGEQKRKEFMEALARQLEGLEAELEKYGIQLDLDYVKKRKPKPQE